MRVAASMDCFTYSASSPSIWSERTSAGLSSLAAPHLRRRCCGPKVSAPFSTRNNGWLTPGGQAAKLPGCIRAVKGTEKPSLDVNSWTKAPSNVPLIEKDNKESVGEELSKTYAAWAKAVEEVANDLLVDVNSGLSSMAVEEKRSRFGWNELAKPESKPFWKLVAEQFDDTLVQILLAAAGVSFILALTDVEEGQTAGIESFTEPIIILSIIVLNAIIGVWQESKAENTVQALKQMQSESARVLRNGNEVAELPARELVPGDIVELRAGDKVSADMRVAFLKSGTIRLQQASLTGESQPVLKQSEGAFEEDIELQGKENMVFSGTTVTNGMCVCIVTNTGMDTELGKIQAQIQDASLANYDSPLTRKLEEFADSLTKFVGAICVLVWLVNYKYFLTWDVSSSFPSNIDFNLEQATYYFKVAVALAVAAIPEGLPAVITTCLALGTRRMAEENAIVRKLPSVETLGCTTVICSDKTGTLTTNEMSVVQIASMQECGKMQCLTVTGTSYNPLDGEVVGLQGDLDSNIDALAQVCSVCNDAGIQFKDTRYIASGMPTEAALLVLVEKLGLQRMKAKTSCVGGQDKSGGKGLARKASGEEQSNPSTSGDAGGDHNEDFGNEYGPPLPTQEELREMEHRRLWKATTTSPPKPDSKKQYLEKELAEEVEARLARILGAQDKSKKHDKKRKKSTDFLGYLGSQSTFDKAKKHRKHAEVPSSSSSSSSSSSDSSSDSSEEERKGKKRSKKQRHGKGKKKTRKSKSRRVDNSSAEYTSTDSSDSEDGHFYANKKNFYKANQYDFLEDRSKKVREFKEGGQSIKIDTFSG
ncbi:hypothetical protein L7F22_022009 [Adiantum nelumboides]|nr:hypothetical protein [Adiantum nelumboides]